MWVLPRPVLNLDKENGHLELFVVSVKVYKWLQGQYVEPGRSILPHSYLLDIHRLNLSFDTTEDPKMKQTNKTKLHMSAGVGDPR
jgi:hypothetical protein